MNNIETEEIKVVFRGETICGTRTVIQTPGKEARQVVEFKGRSREDPGTYRNPVQNGSMIWAARLILLALYEKRH